MFLYAGAARAQAQSLVCTATAGTPAMVRAEGVAEPVSDFVVDCTGGTAGSGTANLDFYFNTTVTSRLSAAGSSIAEPLLIIDDLAQPATVGVNLYAGTLFGNVVRFQGVQFSIPGGSQHLKFRLTNVRVNANAVVTGSESGQALPQILALVSITGTTALPINNPQLTVGYAVPGTNLELRTAADAPAGSISFPAGGLNTGMPGNQTGVPVTYKVVFNEGFSTGFLKRNTATTVAAPTALANQNTPLTAHSTETGWYDSSYPATNSLNTAGLASQGTRLMARFTNIPAGVSVYVTTRQLEGGTAGAAKAVLTAADASGDGAFSAVAQTGTTAEGFGIAPVSIGGGAGAAVWEVLDSASAVEQMTFGVILSYTGSPAGTGSVTGTLAPLSTTSLASATAPVPRFVNSAALPGACTGSDCLGVAPAALTFTYDIGGSVPAAQTVAVTNSGGAATVTAAVTSGAWLSVTPAATTPGTLSISVSPQTLPPGVYTGVVTITRTLPTLVTRTVPVVLTVNSGSGALPFNCIANAAVPPTMRAEGLAELAGDIVLLCGGGSSGSSTTANVQVTLDASVTSRLVNGAGSEALLLVDEPSGAAQVAGTNVFGGTLVSSNTIVFNNVLIAQPGTTGNRILRIANLRVNTGQSTATAPFPVSAALSVQDGSPTGVWVANPAQVIGYAVPGLGFSLRTPAGQPTAMTFQAAGGENTGLLAGGAASGLSYTVRFSEGFATAFKKRNIATAPATPTATANQNVPGAIYNTETGFYNSSFPSGNGLNTAGLATQGTRLVTRFSGVPQGVRLFVTTGPVPNSGVAADAAALVSADLMGGGGFTAVSPSGSVSVNSTPIGIAEVPLSGGAGMAVWEVVADSAFTVQDFTFGVLAAYAAPAGTQQAWPVGHIGPLSSVNTADASSSVPRFRLAANSPAFMLAPPPGVTLPGASQTFTWMPAFGATQYTLTLGNAPGTTEYGVQSTTGTSLAVSGLPVDGRTLYVRLITTIGSSTYIEDYTYRAFGSGAAIMTNPANGTVFTSSSVTFQWAAGGGSQFGIWIGSTGPGSSNLGTAAPSTTSYTATGLPTDGRTLYVRLWSLVGAAWQYNDYTYTAQTLAAAAMLSPANGTVFTSSSVTFQWSAGAATQYGLWIGNAVGTNNLVATGGTATSYAATGLPTDGRTLYVRLWSLVGAAWQFNDYVYTAQTLAAAVMTSPANGSTLTSSSVTFQWTAGAATQYGLWIGNAVGTNNLVATGGVTTSYAATGLPTDGRILYVRLWSLVGAAWQYNDYLYTAQTLAAATMVSPVNGSTLASSSVTFQWTAGGATQYGLWIGNTAGARDLVATGGVTTSYAATGLPTDGRILYVRLWSLVGPAWQYNDYLYTAQPGPAVMTSPANGSTLTSSSVTFQWSAGGATQYGLWVGSTAGARELVAIGGVTTSYTATGLPTDGRILYVRLWSLVGAAWYYNDYLYTAQSATPAAMTSPANGTTLGSSSVTFQWTAGAGTQFGLWIGSTGAGSSNLGTAAPVTTSHTVTGLPTDGRTLNVRLWSLVGGVWLFNDYTYTAQTLSSAAMTSPVNGTTLGSSSVTFQWTAGAGTQFGVWIGSTGPGSSNLGTAAPVTTSYTATGLPTDGRTLNVRLWSLVGAAWQYRDYTYTAAATP
ncbi:MAG: hypothetical protein IT429_13370 [Gemmataceae bacterium]|nr:hypothetical protein [Gemmataceae bacterium]